ncbi:MULTISPECIES: TonB-dependent receptor [unclassified Halomonas]|uniref:TonB-dependent receptor n=1 Tax=unclassified Halomonas TaxID=2609666 RepID=UPI001C97142A|nr:MULTISPECIES: TonB-dependent siderophore receptor [unclassified Halomonas]MBY5924299.1 TonB-dependent siderophore receptor [Halomonas sp. DP4Y7-2]MBY6231341.1 TonB-dependent siderophore receptor [Halomonas sp. DP4Y7-1]
MFALAPNSRLGMSGESLLRPVVPAGLPTLGVAMLAFLPLAALAQEQASTASAGDGAMDLSTVTVVGEQWRDRGHETVPEFSGGQVAAGGRIGILGEESSFDVPFNVISYTDQLIENQQADTLADVLDNDASVQSEYGFGNFAETFSVRGFRLYTDDVSYGGLYGVLPRQIINTSIASRVEVFKGASAFANGIPPGGSGVGGAINIEPKRAPDEPLTRITTSIESDNQVGTTVDVGRRYGEQQQFGVRATVDRSRGDTAIDDEEASATAASVALDYRGERFRASLDLGYQKAELDGGRPIVKAGALMPGDDFPDAPDASSNYGPDWQETSLEGGFGMLRGEYDLSDSWTAYATIGGNNNHESGEYSSLTLQNEEGDATASRLGVPYRSGTVTGVAGIRGDWQTGAVNHQLNLGYSGYSRTTRSAWTLGSAQATNIYHPADLDYPETTFSGGDLGDPNRRSRTITNGVAVSDTLGFLDERVLLTVGARYQDIDIRNFTYEGEVESTVSGDRWTPLYGIVVKPWENVSLYANHIEALQPTDPAPGTANGMPVTNAGQVIGLARSDQNEVGIKYDGGGLGATLSVFRIEQPQAYVNDRNRYAFDGEQVNEGVELSLYGEVTDRLRLLGSATWLDPELRHTADGANDGNDAPGVPEFAAVLGSDWDVTDRFTLEGRVIHTSSQYVDTANEFEIDDWTRLDLGARYTAPMGDSDLILRANIENLTDEDYWASASNDLNYVTMGDPMTVKVSATIDF